MATVNRPRKTSAGSLAGAAGSEENAGSPQRQQGFAFEPAAPARVCLRARSASKGADQGFARSAGLERVLLRFGFERPRKTSAGSLAGAAGSEEPFGGPRRLGPYGLSV